MELKTIEEQELEELRPGMQLDGYNLIGRVFEALNPLDGEKIPGNLVGSTFAGSNMYKARFDGCDMRYAMLEGVDASSATFAGTKLAHCALSHAVMVGAMMERADLSASNLTGTDLRDARLKSSSFKSADLTNAKMGGADLRNVDFDDAIVDGVDFNNATIGRYPMPAKPREPKQPTKATVMRCIAVQLGKATVSADDDDDDGDDDDDEDDDGEDDGDRTQQMVISKMVISMAEEAINAVATGLADLVPHVIAACKNADDAIDAAVEEAREALGSKMGIATMRALDAAAANPDRVAAATAVEGLLQQALSELLEKIFGESGTLRNAVGKVLARRLVRRRVMWQARLQVKRLVTWRAGWPPIRRARCLRARRLRAR